MSNHRELITKKIKEFRKEEILLSRRIKEIESTRKFANSTTQHSLNKLNEKISELEDMKDKQLAALSSPDKVAALEEKAIFLDRQVKAYWQLYINRNKVLRKLVPELQSWDDYQWNKEKFTSYRIAFLAYAPDYMVKEYFESKFYVRDAFRLELKNIEQSKEQAKLKLPEIELQLERNIYWRDRILSDLSEKGLECLQECQMKIAEMRKTVKSLRVVSRLSFSL